MTMRIVIKNEDPTKTAIVTTIGRFADGAYEIDKELRPGEQEEIYIHATKSIVIREQPESK
jgi:hypothetical protein